jgi:hypothetical protein
MGCAWENVNSSESCSSRLLASARRNFELSFQKFIHILPNCRSRSLQLCTPQLHFNYPPCKYNERRENTKKSEEYFCDYRHRTLLDKKKCERVWSRKILIKNTLLLSLVYGKVLSISEWHWRNVMMMSREIRFVHAEWRHILRWPKVANREVSKSSGGSRVIYPFSVFIYFSSSLSRRVYSRDLCRRYNKAFFIKHATCRF